MLLDFTGSGARAISPPATRVRIACSCLTPSVSEAGPGCKIAPDGTS